MENYFATTFAQTSRPSEAAQTQNVQPATQCEQEHNSEDTSIALLNERTLLPSSIPENTPCPIDSLRVVVFHENFASQNQENVDDLGELDDEESETINDE